MIGYDLASHLQDAGAWDIATPQTIASLLDGHKAGAMSYLTTTNPAPITLAFRTREGSAGLLQITGFTENPPGVKIRYKLVENGNSHGGLPARTNMHSSVNSDTNGPDRDYYLMHAWEVSYNLTTNMSSPESQWELLLAAISSLRDQGLEKFPDDVMICRQLAWLFQHRLGPQKIYRGTALPSSIGVRKDGTVEVDPDQLFLRYQWAKLMEQALGDEKQLARLKLDRATMKSVDEQYGPLDWRLPESHAIYWCYRRLQARPAVEGDENKTLQRIIHQSLQLSYQHGNLVGKPTPTEMKLDRNLDLVSKVNASYEQQIKAEDPGSAIVGNIRNGQRNFLRDAVVALYEAGRKEEACDWFERLCQISEKHPLLYDDLKSFPGTLSCEEFVRRSKASSP